MIARADFTRKPWGAFPEGPGGSVSCGGWGVTSGVVGSRPSRSPSSSPEWSRERGCGARGPQPRLGRKNILEPWIGPLLGTLCLPSGLSGLRACLHGRRGRTGPDTVPAFVLAPRPIGDRPSYPSIMITTNTHENASPVPGTCGCGGGPAATWRSLLCDHHVSVEAEVSQLQELA